MSTTIKLNIGDALTTEEVRELTEAALAEHKSLERLVFEATTDFVARRRAARAAAQPQPLEVAA